jgi:hypothetical protein
MQLTLRKPGNITEVTSLEDYCASVLESARASPSDRGGLDRVCVQLTVKPSRGEASRTLYSVMYQHALKQHEFTVDAARYESVVSVDRGDRFNSQGYIREQLEYVSEQVVPYTGLRSHIEMGPERGILYLEKP